MFRNNRTTTSFRRRLTRGAALGALATGLLATSASAATTNVDVNDGKFFNPENVTQTVGGSVHWQASGIDDHSVTQNQLIFDSGAVGPGVNFTRTFSAGTFPYHCLEHGDQGMTGQVRVAPQVLSGPRGLPFTVKWASSSSNTGTRFNVEYRVGTGRWTMWKRGVTARTAVFGSRSRPVRVLRGKTYSFRVRSGNSSAMSGLSPVKSFRAR